MAYLTIRKNNGRRIHELGAQTFVGRGTYCQVLLDDIRASKRHAEIKENAGRFLLSDLSSSNGTLVRGQIVKEPISLEDGDEIIIGDTTMLFTRGLPPGVDPANLGAPDGDGTKRKKTTALLHSMTGLQISERGAKRIPTSTVVIPLERFGLHAEKEPQTAHGVVGDAEILVDKEHWLRTLYRLLREANQCDSENELFSAATRILSETLTGARVRVLFEAGPGATGKDAEKSRGGTMQLVAWADPDRGSSKTTCILEDNLSDARAILLTHAHERCVAVLSSDVEADLRVLEGIPGPRKKTTQLLKKMTEDAERDRTSLLIAPLQAGRTALGYLVAERKYRIAGESGAQRGATFHQAHLEFLAAAAYPLASMLERVRRRQQVLDENERLRHAVETRHKIVGKSANLKACLTVIQRVAPLNSPVLILGESGTGKELIARAVHELSPRSKNAFEAVNCAALPENLVESELFGHAKGSFTGATRDRAGYFEMASGGTLFLDEVGDLPLSAQAKLLRVLEESKVARVGETRLRDIDCRIVAATNRDLAQNVEAGQFRQDLYYRLRVMDVTLPPLRERLDDLPILCKHLLKPLGNFTLHPEALGVLRSYQWPGNIRELKNTLERMAVMSRPTGMTRGGVVQLTVEDVPLDIRRVLEETLGAAPTASLAARRRKTATGVGNEAEALDPTAFLVSQREMVALEELQVRYARWVLDQVKGNKSKAARVLGIQRSTLYAWTEWRDKDLPEGP